MNKKDRSLEEVDILKILIFSFSFIVICAVLILFLIVPFLKDYKLTHSKLARQEIQNTKASNELESLEKIITSFQNTNQTRLAQINSEFSTKDFLKFMQNYFEEVQFKSVPISKPKDYLKYKFSIEAKIKNPQAFYSFLNDLQKYKNLVEIDSPVEFKSKEKYIELKFNANVFYAKAIEK